MAIHVVHKRARVHVCDEDNIGRVKWDGGVGGLAETGHGSISRRSRGGQTEIDGLGGMDLKTTVKLASRRNKVLKVASVRFLYEKLDYVASA